MYELNEKQLAILPQDDREAYPYMGQDWMLHKRELANALLALKEAREVLKEVEWCVWDRNRDSWCCPRCNAEKGHPHTKRCKLAKILAEAE